MPAAAHLPTDAPYTLYGYKGTGSAAVECALALARQPFRLINAASWDAASEIDALRRVNPLVQIPTLVTPQGTVLSESAAILIHLGLAHPDSGLLPAEAAARAAVLRGLVYIAANCYSAIGIIDYPARWLATPDAAAEHNLQDGARAVLHRHWELFADLFTATPFLHGSQPGALDLLAATVSKWSGARSHLRGARPAFWQVLQRVDKHPGVKPVFARHW